MDLHKSEASDILNYERYIIFFKPSFIQDWCTPNTNLLDCFLNRNRHFCHRYHLSENQLDKLVSLLNCAIDHQKSTEFGADLYSKITLAEILIYINKLYQSYNLKESDRTTHEFDRVRPVIEYIHRHLDEEIYVDDLAQQFFLSKHHLGYLFKKTTGFTINEYIINKKILMARELLKDNISVSKVCDMVGFGNLSHFTRTFTKMVGLSPKQYIKTQ